MKRKGEEIEFGTMVNIGELTKNAVENLEENVVTGNHFIEQVKTSEVPYLSDKFH